MRMRLDGDVSLVTGPAEAVRRTQIINLLLETGDSFNTSIRKN
jgi:hypothetical protein